MIDFFKIETVVRRALGPAGRWAPKQRHWWFRWWMYPPDHDRRFIGVGQTWEVQLRYRWLDLLARIIPGRCRECHADNHLHKMCCSKLRDGVKGKRLWSQDG